jgi:hypothetical protein
MYHYLNDKEFLHKMRALSGEIMQLLCHYLKEDYDIGANFYLVGSGAKNLIMQNENNPIDLDYNLEIVRCEDFEDCRHLKECARKTFNKCLQKYDLRDCEDSTSSLTSKLIHFITGNSTNFSIDICITVRDTKDNYYRLIHEKTGWSYNDRYFWNMAPQSKQLKKKVSYIKEHGRWELVRTQYRNIKNKYLTQNDTEHHPSFVCYVEAINNVYNSRNH